MKKWLTYEEVQKGISHLNNHYEIDEERYYSVIEKWANSENSADKMLKGAFLELLQGVSDEINDMNEASNMKPTCRLGCAFCCYFPIIVNGMEAKLMVEAIEDMPVERRNELINHLQQYFVNYEEQIKEATSLDFEEDPHFKKKYIQKQLPCPFLDTQSNVCLAYEARPIPCRTYVNYTNPEVCEKEFMPKETLSYEFLYHEYMGPLNELAQYLFEQGDTGKVQYPNDVYEHNYLPVWLKNWIEEKGNEA
ncbi:YkgJ family cysteine cluster protein [Salirhabdus salicampi]|uniref:YkgJ family cysteine cluster protein n=1 Tax=Salirhabdus salicampi TaxID=476102 RepID=UPI0020C2AD69|nr:YkgJ family cysteine cluster protein [Salirhabdus salicampi]MCP8617903.1 YkgJ family cysteine cluster protein [Salirhabdus salicampi]